MPFYEYECTGCGGRFVRQQKMADPPVTDCPTCRRPVRKLFHAPGVAVKGEECPIAPSCATGGG